MQYALACRRLPDGGNLGAGRDVGARRQVDTFIQENSVERGYFSVKPPEYWREADFCIHLSGEVEHAEGGSACGPSTTTRLNARAASGRSYNAVIRP